MKGYYKIGLLGLTIFLLSYILALLSDPLSPSIDVDAVDLVGTLVAGAVIVLANFKPARKAPPKRWHRKRDHE